jgi:hypothetical protein
LIWMNKTRFENYLMSSMIGSIDTEIDTEVDIEVYTEVEIYIEVYTEISIGSSDLILIVEFSREVYSLL